MAAMYSGVASCSFMISVTSSRSQSGASKSELLGICVSCEFGMSVLALTGSSGQNECIGSHTLAQQLLHLLLPVQTLSKPRALQVECSARQRD